MESKDVVVLVVGVIGLIGAASQPILTYILSTRGKVKDKKPHLLLWASVGIGALTIIAFAIFSLYLFRSDIEIIHPRDGARVGIHNEIKGKSRNLPTQRTIRVVIYSYKDQRYYPHTLNVIFDANGMWSSQNVSIGGTADADVKFDVLALLIDEVVQEEIDNIINQPEFVGIEQLPKSTVIRDQTTVRRR